MQKEMDVYSDLNILNNVPFRDQGRTILSVERKYAEIALNFYEKRQDFEFEILEVLFSNRAKLAVPGYEGDGLWCHVSFIAKPTNAGCIDDSPKHFFGEMLFDRAEEKYNVTHCSIFEPDDPRNVEGCVFCPPNEGFLHPVDGCPAGGRESDKYMAEKGMDASQGQRGACSKRHPYPLNGAAEFEIVEALFAARKPVVVSESKCEEWWCHVTFTAKPRNADCSDVSLKYFFGELSRDNTSGKYIASYCEIFEPSDRRITHGCLICPPLDKHPFDGFYAGRPPSIRLQVECSSVEKKKHVSSVYPKPSREKIDGESESPQVKRSRVEKKKHSSGVQSEVDASREKMGGDSERVNKKNDVSGVETGVNISHEQMGGVSGSHQFNKLDMVESGVDAFHGKLGGDSERVNKNHDVSGVETGVDISYRQIEFGLDRFNPTISSSHGRLYANIALKFYEKEKDAGEHEIIQVLFANRKSVVVPGYKDVSEWCHVRFIAKPINTDRSPENFFGEIVLDRTSGTHNVVNCCTFKPSGAGLTYGCGFCQETPYHLHPAYAYVAGLPSSTYPMELSYEYLADLEAYGFDKFFYR